MDQPENQHHNNESMFEGFKPAWIFKVGMKRKLQLSFLPYCEYLSINLGRDLIWCTGNVSTNGGKVIAKIANEL